MYIYILLVLFSFGVYYNKSIISFYNTKKSQYYVLKNILNTLQNVNSTPTSPLKKANFAINDTGKSANIIYERVGKKYLLNIPFDRTKTVSMSNLSAHLIMEDNSSVEITQQSGVPYMVTPRDLGGVKIKIVNLENKQEWIYEADVIPMYANEVLD